MSATLTGVDDDLEDDGETVVVSATHNGVPFGDRRTVTIEDDDDPEVTVSFSQKPSTGRLKAATSMWRSR